jgi:hypothetical protein
MKFSNSSVDVTSRGKEALALVLQLVTDNWREYPLSAKLEGDSLVLFTGTHGSPFLFSLTKEALIECVWAFLEGATYPNEPLNYDGSSGRGWKITTGDTCGVLCEVTPTLALFHK